MRQILCSRIYGGGKTTKFVNKKYFFIIFSFLFLGTFGFAAKVEAAASDVYIAQTAAGAGDGTSCANAYAVTFLTL